MIKEEKINIKGHPRNLKYYRNLGYSIEVGKLIKVNVEDLSKGTSSKITCICKKCNKEIKNAFKDYWNYTKGLKNNYYCNSCKTINSKKTNLKKWGVDNPMKSKVIKNKLEASMIEKYNVSHYSKTPEWNEKYKKTSLKNWGVDNPSKSKFIIDKIKKINNKRYGVDYPTQNTETIEKSKNTFNKKYNVDWISKSNFYKEKSKETSNQKWGVDSYSKTNEYKNRVIDTNLEKWGGHPSNTEYFKNKSKNTKQRKTFKRYAELISNKYEFLSYNNEEFTLRHYKCDREFKVNKGLLRARYNLSKTICVCCNPVGVIYSNFEKEVVDFIKSLDINFTKNNKNILKGKELDIYIPDYNIAIECNGIYWHSELFKNEKYHLNKTLDCKNKNISLLHIWEDDWYDKKEIVKSIIKNRLNKTKKIGARQCLLKTVNTKKYKKFLNDNHIQGYASSSVNLGLYYKKELVSLMTFGWKRTNNKKSYELIRFCNVKNTTVIGGASKLFKYFINNYNFNEIISYADISLFSGDIYEKLGFKFNNLSKPNYYWVIDKKRKHRYNYSKRKLVNDGYDPNKTEIEIMNERGYYRIFSTGQKKYIYR